MNQASVQWPFHACINSKQADRRTDGGRSSVANASDKFKSEDPGFDTLVEQGEGQYLCPSESTLVQTCLCLTHNEVYPKQSTGIVSKYFIAFLQSMFQVSANKI